MNKSDILKKSVPYSYLLATIIILGGFISFLFLARTGSAGDALLIGFFYAAFLVLVIFLVQKTVINKLVIFNPLQQWIMRAFIYMITLSAAYLCGLIFQTVILARDVPLQTLIGQKLWNSLIGFISSPFDIQLADNLFKEEYRMMWIPFFAVIMLIALISLLGSYVEIRWQHTKRQKAIDQAELTALRAQIEPHFLFNSLNTIAAEISRAPENAEKLIIKLSDILRYLFDNRSVEKVTLKEELDFVRKYLSLMQARFKEQLVIKWQDQSANVDIPVPFLILQPIVENAVRHGWPDKEKKLIITLSIQQEQHLLLLNIHDNGRGIVPERLQKLPLPGHALANIRERLSLIYHKKELLKITSVDGQGTNISIMIPLE